MKKNREVLYWLVVVLCIAIVFVLGVNAKNSKSDRDEARAALTLSQSQVVILQAEKVTAVMTLLAEKMALKDEVDELKKELSKAGVDAESQLAFKQAMGQLAIFMMGGPPLFEDPIFAEWWSALQGTSSMKFAYDPAAKSGILDVPWYEGTTIRYHYSLQGESFKVQFLDQEGILYEFASEPD